MVLWTSWLAITCASNTILLLLMGKKHVLRDQGIALDFFADFALLLCFVKVEQISFRVSYHKEANVPTKIKFIPRPVHLSARLSNRKLTSELVRL